MWDYLEATLAAVAGKPSTLQVSNTAIDVWLFYFPIDESQSFFQWTFQDESFADDHLTT